MILETLSLDFLQFKSNYFMNRLQYNLNELLNELQTFESISKEDKPQANVAEANMAQSSKKNNKRKKKTGGKEKAAGTNKIKRSKNNQGNTKKPKGTCFHCGIDGH